MDTREFFALAAGEIAGPIFVGRVSSSVRRSLDATTRVVLMSRDTIEKQMKRHGQLTLSGYYDYLPDILKNGKAFRMHDRRVSLVLDIRHIHGRRFNAVVKATSNHEELFAISFYPLREKDWNRVQRKYNPIP